VTASSWLENGDGDDVDMVEMRLFGEIQKMREQNKHTLSQDKK
jgi:hypothetical protein